MPACVVSVSPICNFANIFRIILQFYYANYSGIDKLRCCCYHVSSTCETVLWMVESEQDFCSLGLWFIYCSAGLQCWNNSCFCGLYNSEYANYYWTTYTGRLLLLYSRFYNILSQCFLYYLFIYILCFNV